MRKWIVLITAALAVFATGCLGRQLRSDIEDYTRNAASRTPAENVSPAAQPDEIMQDVAGDGTLGGYVLVALERNPAIAAAKGRWLAAKARVVTESSLEDPMVMYARFVKEVDERRDAGFSQQIPTPPKLAVRGRAAREEAAMAEQEYMAMALDVAMNVKNAYHELYYIKNALAVTRENGDILKSVIQIAQAQLRANKATQGDVLKAQVEYDKNDSDILLLEQEWESMLADFNTLLYRPLSSEVVVPEKIEMSENVPEPEELYREALKRKPEILQADAAIRQSGAMLLLAKLKRVPDMTIGVDWMQMLMMEGGTDGAVRLTFGFNLPIWLHKLKAQELEARALQAAAEAERDSIASMAFSQVRSTHYKYITAKKLEALYADSLIPHAEQALKLSKTGYEAAKIDILDVLDSQRTLLMFKLARLRASVDRYQRLAELERAVGMPLTREPASGDTK
jgi:outer membrane protein TolC